MSNGTTVDPTQPFPFPEGYWQDHRNKIGVKNIRDYIEIFDRRRRERPGGVFAMADIEELMRLAEDIQWVSRFEAGYIRELAEDRRLDYFKDDAQRDTLLRFAETHEAVNAARKSDDLVEAILDGVPIEFFREPVAALRFITAALELSRAVRDNEDAYQQTGTFDPDLVAEVNSIARRLGRLSEGFTLSDIDKPGKKAKQAFARDLANLFRRLGGKTDHEAKFKDGKWVNWNRDITVYPKQYKKPANRQEMIDILEKMPGPVRMVAGGHAFNITPSMGGRKRSPLGTLVTLDKYRLDNGDFVKSISAADARRDYKVSSEQADRVVRASAGIRLRDFGKEMWGRGMALPVAGSTDAQSIGGLIATDLHSTGHTAGFLSQQLLEVKVLNAEGEPVTFTRDDSTDPGDPQRWRWTHAGGGESHLAALPVSGAVGTCGVVVEAVLKLDPAFNFRKSQQFLPRSWAEDNIARLLDPEEDEELFRYDHVSFYYAGGLGVDIPTVRMNTWRRTTDEVSEGAEVIKTVREALDHIGSAFLPEALLDLSKLDPPVPGQPGSGHRRLRKLNDRPQLVLQANEAFARKLFFQHDEIEVGIPLKDNSGNVDYDIFRRAIAQTQRLLQREEFETIIEVRFTPDASEAMLGPGTGGPACYIELATPLGVHSKARIVQVFHLFDTEMRNDFNARPHLGKKTAATASDMADLYRDNNVWTEFQRVRAEIDPANRFIPDGNPLLNQIFIE